MGRDVAMTLLAAFSIGLLWYEATRELDEAQARQLLYLDLAIVGVFWVEYLARLAAATDRGAFVRANWYELPGMVPIFPSMQSWASIRVFRLLRILRVLRLVGALRRFDRFERNVGRYVHQSKIGYVALLAVVVVFLCAGIVWIAEPAEFTTFGDALWWSVVTAATVGYGDLVPETTGGRLIGVVLMVLGVGLIGTLAGTLSSFLVDRRVTDRRDQASPAPSGPLPMPGMDLAHQIERLAALRQRGDLTQEEFERAKRRLLE